jgi:threonine dehydrogenase-like Zn-dependent dehydrogenase
MKAIQFNFTKPRYALGLVLGKLSSKIYWSGLSCTDFKDIPEPELPGDEWVKVKTKFGGICGSDTSQVKLILTPYYEPLNSPKHIIGHENMGRIAEIGAEVDGWQIGDRVVAEPLLWCKPRGFTELCRYCAQGEINRCERFSEGNIARGIQIGACLDTGGSWSPYYMAHESQLYKIPDNVSDENALLIEPFSSALHAVLNNFPRDDEKVMVVGAGTIGLGALAALRALDSKADILVLGRYDYQAEAARKLGASQVILTDRNDDYYEESAVWSGGAVKQPPIGRRIVVGGADITFDCVGSSGSIDDATRLTRNGGRVILVGTPGVINLDWTSIDSQELEIKSSFYYNHAENFDGKRRKTFDLAIDLMEKGKIDLGWMLTHRFQLEDYRQAFDLSDNRVKNQAIKIAFEFEE